VTTSDKLAPPAGAAGPTIRIDRLSKRYRLYTKPIFRLLDLFGICPAGPNYYREHAALTNVELSISRGEKVAIIGRNGAGKSTLLKVITGIVRPTNGTVDVAGQVSNLLQIGSGFHPDFTGRQNVFASLAHQGIAGAAAARLFDEIVEFAEIEEYIDQPMKTYSTGMCSRLMFSSSVIVKPEILIVDEILGVGDAYFAHKSFERMRDLCRDEGTTLLLVTHDIYSALSLCDRFIWIDRGEVKFDGEGKAAIALYETSVKDQEEQWLRQQNAAKLAAAGGEEDTQLHLLVRSQTGFAFPSPFALEMISLDLAGGPETLMLAEETKKWELSAEGNLGPVETVAGRTCRAIRTAGSIYHKAEWVIGLPSDAELRGVTVRWHYEGDVPADVRVFTTKRRVLVAGTLSRGAGWQEQRIAAATDGSFELDPVQQSSYGTGVVRITDVRFLVNDRDVVEVRHGDPLIVRVSIKVSEALQGERVLFVLGFNRHASPYSALIHEEHLTLPRSDDAEISVDIARVQLGSGAWYVVAGIGEPGLYDKPAVKYFTVNPSWHHLLASRLDLKVGSISTLDAAGCFVVLPATVSARTVWAPGAVEVTEGAPR
jgi:ABC-type polysaccharide/polyol phosphate transport system ATPase subunit